jgi:hypothetical protein
MSEIFKNYVKIIQENAKIAKASHAEHTEKSFKETNPRMDSLSIEQISKLYGVKPNLPKDMEYKKNIMEDAHPESCVLSPAHDKLNGLVENEMEGQAIRINIVNKTPDGLSTQHKYAKQDFIYSLVTIANELDRQNKTDLLALADVCLKQAAGKPIEKTAFWPLAMGVLGVIIYAKQHLRFHSDGFDADFEKVVKEIEDITNANSNWGIGYSYNPQFIDMMDRLSQELQKVYSSVHTVLPILERVEMPRERAELAQIAKQPETQQAAQAIQNLRSVLSEVNPFFDKIMRNFQNEGFKQRAILHKGWMSSLVDVTEVLHGGYGFISDDFDDVRNALETLRVDIENITKSLSQEGAPGAAESEIRRSDVEVGQMVPEAPQAAAPKQEAIAPELSQQLEQLFKQFTPEQIQAAVAGLGAKK